MPESVRQGIMGTSEACGKGIQTRGKGILKQFFLCFSYRLLFILYLNNYDIGLHYLYLSVFELKFGIIVDIILSFNHNQLVYL